MIFEGYPNKPPRLLASVPRRRGGLLSRIGQRIRCLFGRHAIRIRLCEPSKDPRAQSPYTVAECSACGRELRWRLS